MFDAFWKAYPKKVAKDAARKAFNRRKPDEELLKTILKAVEQHKHSDTWSRGYVPNPATWINDARWQDEIVGKPAMTVAINKQEALEARNRAVVQRLLQKEGLA